MSSKLSPGSTPTACSIIILRQRQYAGGLVEKKYIDALSDNDMIDSYITCSGCSAKFVSLDDLDLIIKRARSTERFIAAIAPHTH